MRQRTERHRTNAACASCHVRMDPLGFALEPFDGIGRLRTTDEAGDPIDATSVLPDGTTIQGIAGVRALVMQQPDVFVRTLTMKLMTYALGRPVTDADMPEVRRIVRDAAKADYRWSALIQGIVRSAPFRMRHAAS